MDITPSQPAPSPTPTPTGKPKAASTVAANSNKKPRNKQPGAQKPAPAVKPVENQVIAAPMSPMPTPPIEAIEEQLTEDMDGMIATAAYYLAERRNFAPGHELDDWLEAEQQLRR